MNISLGRLEEVEVSDELFSGVINDEQSVEDVRNRLSSLPLVIVRDGEEVCGFASLEVVNDDYIESHIFLYPHKRKFSVKLVRLLIDLIWKTGKIPLTSVTGDFPHIIRFLEICGFDTIKVDKNSVKKNGQTYDRFFLSHFKYGGA